MNQQLGGREPINAVEASWFLAIPLYFQEFSRRYSVARRSRASLNQAPDKIRGRVNTKIRLVYSGEYAREHLPNERFDYALFQRLARFPQSAPGLQRIRHDELTCMFWVISDRQPAIWSDGNVEITDVLDVTFDWEQP